MTNEPTVITREARYEQVWVEPISKITSRFNLSDRQEIERKGCGTSRTPTPQPAQ